jgi:hypothetical protein
MKKMIFASLAIALGLTIYACGGGGKSAQNPNDAAAEFTSPTGKLTSTNADDVSNAAVDSKNSNGVAGSASYLSKNNNSKIDSKYFPSNALVTQAAIDECVDASSNGTTSTTDWECLAPFLGETETSCVGTGTTKTSFNDAEDFTSTEFNDWSLNCTGDTSLTFTCDGTQSVALESAVVCSNLTCESTDFTLNWEGCVKGTDYLVKIDDKGFVIENVEANAECSTVSLTIRDADGTSTVSCTVSSKTSDCSNLEGVKTVASCTIE